MFEYTTQPLSDSVTHIYVLGALFSLFVVLIGVVVFEMDNELAEINGKDVSKRRKMMLPVGAMVFVATMLPFIGAAIKKEPPLNEPVTATMVDTGEAAYKSGKHSIVRAATVTYQLEDGGLVTFRADGGGAWYPKITLYKNKSK